MSSTEPTNTQGESLPVEERIVLVWKMLMARNGEKQRDMAALFHTDQGTISTLLRCKSKLTLAHLEMLVEHYNVPVGTFFAGPDALFGNPWFGALALVSGGGDDVDPGDGGGSAPVLSLVR